MRDRIDIILVYPDHFSAEFGDSIIQDVGHKDLQAKVVMEPPRILACAEWFVPGAIAAYILKPYFEAFLTEAGKDHYQVLKSTLAKLLRTAKLISVRTIVPSTSKNKLNPSNTQSKAFSVYFQLKSGLTVKLMFDNNLPVEVWIAALEDMMVLVEDHYSTYPDDELTARLNTVYKKGDEDYFAIIDQETKTWKILNSSQVIQLGRL